MERRRPARGIWPWLGALLLLALAACAPQPTPTQPPTATPAPATPTPPPTPTPTPEPVELTPTRIPATPEATQQATPETTPQATPQPATPEAENDAAGTEVDLAQLSTEEIIQRIQEKLKEPKEGQVRLTFSYPGSIGQMVGVKVGIEEVLKFAGIFDEIKELIARGEPVIIYVEGKGWVRAKSRRVHKTLSPKFCMHPKGISPIKNTFGLDPRRPFTFLNEDAKLALDASTTRRAGYVVGTDPTIIFGSTSQIPPQANMNIQILFEDGTVVASLKLNSEFLDYRDRVFYYKWEVAQNPNGVPTDYIIAQCTK